MSAIRVADEQSADEQMKFGTAHHPSSPIVPEMLHRLPLYMVVLIITNLFRRRAAGHASDAADWRKLFLVFIGKVAHPHFMKDFRGVFLVVLMCRWYMACLVLHGLQLFSNGFARFRLLPSSATMRVPLAYVRRT